VRIGLRQHFGGNATLVSCRAWSKDFDQYENRFQAPYRMENRRSIFSILILRP
jgi:hypothetical protein